MITRLIPLLVSSLLTVSASAFLLKGLAATDRTALATTQELVSAGAAHIEASLKVDSRAMVGVIPNLVRENLLGVDLRTLSATVNLVPPSGTVTERLQARIKALQDKLRDRMAGWRDSRPRIDGFCLVDDVGVVMLSDIPIFKEGHSVPILEKQSDAETATSKDATSFELDLSSESTVQTYTQVTEAGVFWLTAAPIYQKTQLAGALIVVSQLRALAATPGAEATLFSGEKALLGSASNFDHQSNRATKASALLQPTSPAAGIGLLFVEPEHIGVWGRQFSVPNTSAVRGFVTADLSPFYAELAERQTMTLIIMGLLLVAHLALLFMGGWRLRAGIRKLLTQTEGNLQGKRGKLDEKAFAPELIPLVKMVNRDVLTPSNAVAPLAVSPSLDEVLQAQNVDGDAESDDGKEKNGSSIFADPTREVDMDVSVTGDDPRSSGEAFASDTEDLEPFSLDPGDPLSPDLDNPELPDAEIPTAGGTTGSNATDASMAETDALLANADAVLADDEAVLTDDGGLQDVFTTASDNASPFNSASKAENPFDAMAETLDGETAQNTAPAPEPALGDMLDEFATDATAMMQLTPEIMAAMKKTVESLPEPPTKEESQRRPPASPELLAAPRSNGDQHFQNVFEQFVEVRKDCGESISELTFDKFAAKLAKSREAVMAKHQCSDVRFQVYVKDGKAALKAVPAR
ncbi:MAG: hypothetical protein A2341_28565 [Deltaproteobacteria bacterium RIFOXYB12_FULL_58_9]|nr:MAG: hypothetical protein A2341_28565 [Deltaproteobacteria bacterium RIFOXYB12_FULL_58_9]